MSDLKLKFITKYNESMNHLHKVGDQYVDNSHDNEKAKDNLFKVYHGYSIASVIIAYGVLIGAIVAVLVYHHYAWIVAMPLAVMLPKSFQWSMQNVLNIDQAAYYHWRQEKKDKK